MMFDPRAQHAIERSQLRAQPNRLSFRHFAENDFLLENVAAAGDGPTVHCGCFTFEHGSGSRDNAEVRSRNEMNRMREREAGKEVRPVRAGCWGGGRGILAHGCSG